MKSEKSLLRRFAILYMGFSVLPFLFIYYLFTRYDDSRSLILISYDRFIFLTFLIGLITLAGYFSMRVVLNRLSAFAASIKKNVYEKVDAEIMLKLANEQGEIGELAKSFSQIITRLDDNVRELEETKKTLHSLMAKVSNVLSSVENLDSLISLVLDTAIDALGMQKGIIFSFDESHYTLRAKVGQMSDVPVEQALSDAKPYLDLIAREGRHLVIPAVDSSPTGNGLFAPPLLCVPLGYRGKTMGALFLCGKGQGTNFTEDDISIASNLCNQIAIAFENDKLNADVEQTYFETMAALAMAVEARDPYSRGHSDRVGEYARKIALHIGLQDESIKTLRDASRMHDVGKIGILDSILAKQGELSKEEADVMKQHPAIGESILMPLKTFRHLLDPVRHHHENLLGTGYPDGLRGEEVKPITRILTVADIFDALTTDRPYRKAMNAVEIRKELDKLVSEGKVDGQIVSHLYTLIKEGEINPYLPSG